MIYAKILVKGNVQNVHYRDYVVSIAKALEINGVARHCCGDVEVEVEAKSESELEEFVRLLEKHKDEKFGIDVKEVAIVSKTPSDGAKFVKFSME